MNILLFEIYGIFFFIQRQSASDHPKLRRLASSEETSPLDRSLPYVSRSKQAKLMKKVRKIFTKTTKIVFLNRTLLPDSRFSASPNAPGPPVSKMAARLIDFKFRRRMEPLTHRDRTGAESLAKFAPPSVENPNNRFHLGK